MKRKFITMVFIAVAGLTGICSVAEAKTDKPTSCDFRSDMRKLWSDHVFWTRNVIFNILDNLPGTTEAVNRLMRNQDDIGNAIKPFYGDAAGNQLSGLLHTHIALAARILTDLKTGNTSDLAIANTNWYLNADSIALFLSNANPNWPFAQMQDMMHRHLDLTTAEALARFNANYSADVVAFDSVYVEILTMADMLSSGIEKQFPAKFAGGAKAREAGATGVGGEKGKNSEEIVLQQNAPNPFAEKTVVNYFIPQNVTAAQICISDMNGKVIKTVTITEKGAGNITVYAPDLSNGLYTYSIIADGRVMDTKKMLRQN